MSLSRDEIMASLHGHRNDLNAFGLKRVGLYGSYARNQQTEKSDIDILVEFAEGKKSFTNFMRLCDFMETLLQHPVDIVTIEGVNPRIMPYIQQDICYEELQ
jgi:predicted nucleotidyltransferase